ncbi:MAG TPA: oligopeptide ABC transporter permease [Candidatus Limnocylindrales bacterium]|nr:oligopeptide ABC transporter permease [Candidatus Limnocylindrales bacterium]
MRQSDGTTAEITRSSSKKAETTGSGNIIWHRFRRNKVAMVSLVVLSVIVAAVILAPVLVTHGRDVIDLGLTESPPSARNWLGTDALGRDIYTRLLYGGRISLAVAVIATTLQMGIGIFLGSVAGYYGGFVKTLVMRLTDTVLSFPYLALAIVAAAIMGPGIYSTMLIIGLLSWTGTCRLVYGQFLSIRETEYVKAARALGFSPLRIIRKHMLPNAMAPLVVNATLAMAAAILIEAGLSFLGLGVQGPIPSWGNMLQAARNMRVIMHMPWIWAPPGVAIFLTVLTINLIGDGLRDAFDPRLKG